MEEETCIKVAEITKGSNENDFNEEKEVPHEVTETTEVLLENVENEHKEENKVATPKCKTLTRCQKTTKRKKSKRKINHSKYVNELECDISFSEQLQDDNQDSESSVPTDQVEKTGNDAPFNVRTVTDQNEHTDEDTVANDQKYDLPNIAAISPSTNQNVVESQQSDTTEQSKLCYASEIDHVNSLQPDKQDNFLMNPDILTSAMQSLVRSPDFSFLTSVAAEANMLKGSALQFNYNSDDLLTPRHFPSYFMNDTCGNNVPSLFTHNKCLPSASENQQYATNDFPALEAETTGITDNKNKENSHLLNMAEHSVDNSSSFKDSVSSTSLADGEQHFIPETDQNITCDKDISGSNKAITYNGVGSNARDTSGYHSFSNMSFHRKHVESTNHPLNGLNGANQNITQDPLHIWETGVTDSCALQNRPYNTLPDMATFSNNIMGSNYPGNNTHATTSNCQGSCVAATHSSSLIECSEAGNNGPNNNNCTSVYMDETDASQVHCCQRHYQSPGNPLACSKQEISDIHNHHTPCNSVYVNDGHRNSHSCCHNDLSNTHCCPRNHAPVKTCSNNFCSPRRQSHHPHFYAPNNNSCQPAFGCHMRRFEGDHSCKTLHGHASGCQTNGGHTPNRQNNSLIQNSCHCSSSGFDINIDEHSGDSSTFSTSCDTRCHSRCNENSMISDSGCSSEKYARGTRRYDLRQTKSEDKLVKKKRPRQRYYKRPLMSNSNTSEGINLVNPQFSHPPPSTETTLSKKELVCRYVDYLVQENECLTQLSKTFIVPSDLLVTEEMYRYVLRIAFETKIRFPTVKFLQWVKKFYPKLEIQSMDLYCLNSVSFPFTKSLEGKHNEDVLEEMFFYFQRKKIQCSALK